MQKPHPKVRPLIDDGLPEAAEQVGGLAGSARMATLAVGLSALIAHVGTISADSQADNQCEKSETHAHSPFMEAMPAKNNSTQRANSAAMLMAAANVHTSVECQ